MLPQSDIDKIIEYLSPVSCFAYLFGSVAKGQHNKESDLDLAVYFNETPGLDTIVKIVNELENKISLKMNIDLIALNDASTILIYQIINKGKLLYVHNETFLKNYIIQKNNEYIDFKFFRKELEQGLMQRFL